MSILNEIVASKRRELTDLKKSFSVKTLEQRPDFDRPCLSTKRALLQPGSSGIIAEFKRRSPSRGVINDKVIVEEVVRAYQLAGASAISVLTDNQYFGGTAEDLLTARKAATIPLLRKEFIIDEFQIIESKSLGADVILLIAGILDPEQVRQFTIFAHHLGLEVLLEVHTKDELLNHLTCGVDMMGVNNRDLRTFRVSVETSITLSDFIPPNTVAVSESGIENVRTIVELRRQGFRGFLMGQLFMESIDPGDAAKQFISDLYHQWKHS